MGKLRLIRLLDGLAALNQARFGFGLLVNVVAFGINGLYKARAARLVLWRRLVIETRLLETLLEIGR